MQTQPESMMISIGKIVPDIEQPRKNFDAARMAELIDSIKENGILSPLIVEKFPDGTYVLEDGERRYRAAKEIGLKEVPVYITTQKNSTERLIMQFHLQEQKQGWTPIEKAIAVARLAEEMGINSKQVAKVLSLPERTMSNYMAFGSLIEKKRFEKEEVPIDFANTISSVKKTIRTVYKDHEEKMTREIESAIENSIITRVRRGEITGRPQINHYVDIAKQDFKGFKKLIADDSVDLEEVFSSSNAKPLRIRTNMMYQMRYVRALIARGTSLDFEKNFTIEDKAQIKSAATALNELASRLG